MTEQVQAGDSAEDSAELFTAPVNIFTTPSQKRWLEEASRIRMTSVSAVVRAAIERERLAEEKS